MKRARVAGGSLALWLASSHAAADDAPFQIQEIASPDRAIQADLADFDGDGRADLLWTSSRGLPPEEQRELRIHLAGPDGMPSQNFSWRSALPPGVAAYDLAEVDGQPGTELLLLRRDRITVFSLAGGSPVFHDIMVPGEPTLAAVADERGVDRLRIVREGLGPRPRLLVPGFGSARILELDGTLVAKPEVGGRANFLVPPDPGPIISESAMEIYFDHPRLTAGDVDGDGRGDLVATGRHELRVFRQRDDTSFPAQPDLRMPLRRISLPDHIRTSGSVRVEPHDFDGDGRLDLLVSVASGSLLGGDTRISFHRNRGGTWNLDANDQLFESKGGFATHEVIDLDGDGRAELIVILVPTGVLELVQLLLTKGADADVKIYQPATETFFDPNPWQRWTESVRFDFETLRMKGFVPTVGTDVNGDGFRDMVDSGGGTQLVVRLGDRVEGFRTRTASQALDTRGRIRFGDLGGDGLADFVLYDPRRPGAPLLIGRNLGKWPETANAPPVLKPATTPRAR
ncbi:MAG TPA: VCBS repeat-containing protein [Myxococcota bacterium]|nr:VCBS repeat-containing protein [Myxococcota bacterium]